MEHLLGLLQPFAIIDIVLGSWGRYDYGTLGYCLRAVSNRAIG